MSDWYDINKTKIGNNTLDLGALTDPKMIAIEEGLYTFSQAHEFLDDVPVGARLDSVDLASVTFGTSSESYLDAADPTYVSPAIGNVVAFIIYEDTAVEATSPLLLFIDSGVTLPILTESGRDLEITFNSNGIAKL